MKIYTPMIGLGFISITACTTTPNPPTVGIFDVERAYHEAYQISALPLTATNDLPMGSVIYEGQLGADVRGDASGSILGDMTMGVNFATSDIDGVVSNINLIDDNGRPNQRFDGYLQIDGFENSGRLDAIAVGTITGVDNDGFVVDSDLVLWLDGDVYDDVGYGDAVYGSAEGEAVGDFYLDVDGVFFGTAD